MSNYVKSTDFAGKDGLTSGDPAKIVKGTEIDDEFDALAAAINSKANTNSPALTGAPTAPTATAGTNSTQLATTAFVTNKVNLSAFTLIESGTDLLVKYNGTTIAKITSAGAFVAKNDVTAFGSL